MRWQQVKWDPNMSQWLWFQTAKWEKRCRRSYSDFLWKKKKKISIKNTESVLLLIYQIRTNTLPKVTRLPIFYSLHFWNVFLFMPCIWIVVCFCIRLIYAKSNAPFINRLNYLCQKFQSTIWHHISDALIHHLLYALCTTSG